MRRRADRDHPALGPGAELVPDYRGAVGQTEGQLPARVRASTRRRWNQKSSSSPRGEQLRLAEQRAAGVKKILGSSKVKVLDIPNAKQDTIRTKAKVKAAFDAATSLDSSLRSRCPRPPVIRIVPEGTKIGTSRRRPGDEARSSRQDAGVRDRPAAVHCRVYLPTCSPCCYAGRPSHASVMARRCRNRPGNH